MGIYAGFEECLGNILARLANGHTECDLELFLYTQQRVEDPCPLVTVVALSKIDGRAVVYHNFKFSYQINEPGVMFFEDLHHRRLVAANQPHVHYWNKKKS